MKCKTCGKSFHACTSCSLSNEWEWYYCTEKCWKKSQEYKHNNSLINKFIVSLTEEQLSSFKEVFELNEDYAFVVEDLIKEAKGPEHTKIGIIVDKSNATENLLPAYLPQGDLKESGC